MRSRIHRKGRRNKPLSEREKQGNKTRSSVRVRVEHVFGAQSNDMGGTLVRSVGLVRAKARIGLKTSPTTCAAWSNWSVSRRPCDDTRRRRPPGDGLVAEITQLERGDPENLGSGMAGAGDNLVKQYPPGNSPILRGAHMSLCGNVDAAGIRMPLHRFAGTIRRNKHRDDRAHGRLQNPLAQNDVRAGEPSRRGEARWNKWKGQLWLQQLHAAGSYKKH